MDKVLPTLAIVAIVIVIFGAMWWGWRRRSRRDAALQPVQATPATLGEVRIRAAAFYVATTEHDKPLERLAIKGLSFRGRADVIVADAGLVIAITGENDVFIPADALVSADVSSLAIDRVVEPGGLVRIAWHINTARGTGTGPVVDSFVRVIEPAAAESVLRTLNSMCPAPAGQSESEVEHGVD